MALSAFSGIIDAFEFAYGYSGGRPAALQVVQGSTSSGAYTIVCSPANIQTSGGAQIAISVNTPITIGSDSGIETVTPTAVSTNNLNQLLITATFANAHGTGAQVRSGDGGLQEAAAFAISKGGGVVALSAAWFQAMGGHTAGIAALVALHSLATGVYTVADYSGISGAVSYAAASGSVYATTSHVLY
jgi:hypothetical protein